VIARLVLLAAIGGIVAIDLGTKAWV